MSGCVSVCVHDVKGKWLELSMSNLVDIQCLAGHLQCISPEVKRSKIKVTRLSSVGLQVNMTA